MNYCLIPVCYHKETPFGIVLSLTPPPPIFFFWNVLNIVTICKFALATLCTFKYENYKLYSV